MFSPAKLDHLFPSASASTSSPAPISGTPSPIFSATTTTTTKCGALKIGCLVLPVDSTGLASNEVRPISPFAHLSSVVAGGAATEHNPAPRATGVRLGSDLGPGGVFASSALGCASSPAASPPGSRNPTPVHSWVSTIPLPSSLAPPTKLKSSSSTLSSSSSDGGCQGVFSAAACFVDGQAGCYSSSSAASSPATTPRGADAVDPEAESFCRPRALSTDTAPASQSDVDENSPSSLNKLNLSITTTTTTTTTKIITMKTTTISTTTTISAAAATSATPNSSGAGSFSCFRQDISPSRVSPGSQNRCGGSFSSPGHARPQSPGSQYGAKLISPTRRASPAAGASSFPTIEPYVIMRQCGQGAYARVYLGHHRDSTSASPVALKVISKAEIARSPQPLLLETMLRSELAVMRTIGDDPFCCHLLDHLEDEERHVLVLDYLRGGDLFDLLAHHNSTSGYLPRRRVIDIFRRVVAAVAHLHSKNIAHRDLKVENLMLDQHGRVRLIDFGMSLQIAPDRYCDHFVGTPEYASPELLQHLPYKPAASDIWALGVLLFYLLEHRVPFATTDDTLRGQYAHHRVDCCPQLVALVRDMLAVDPQQRPSATQILQELDELSAPSMSASSSTESLSGLSSSSSSSEALNAALRLN